ncbi:competence protein ComK [Tepidanaerobacter syntrophicus]|uniref:competence protein ComK n=1 Tax=Tepidanaerobacter syntrophicus TaxID=224999 RepID=UPI001BD62E04|nr:competence protein ComK [Tepidanaerobacter syntrophicus]
MDAKDIIQRKVAALLPIYDRGNVTIFIAGDGEKIVIRKTCKTVLKTLAHCHNVDLVAARKNCGKVLNKKLQVPIPLTPKTLLIPVKFREKPLGKNDGALGYLNFFQIKEVNEAKNRKCIVSFYNGVKLKVPITCETMKEYLKNARIVERIFLRHDIPEQGSVMTSKERPAEIIYECICTETRNAVEEFLNETFAGIPPFR